MRTVRPRSAALGDVPSGTFPAGGTARRSSAPPKTVADEYAQFGVTVNTVAPGWIETQNAIAYLDRQAGLSSPGGAGYVNGAWIEVDGAHHRSAF